MNANVLLKLNKIKTQKIGKFPVVILPLDDFEKMKEDLVMYQSRTFKKDITRAREEVKKGKLLTFRDVKKNLKLK